MNESKNNQMESEESSVLVHEEERAGDRVAHVPLELLESVIEVGEPWDGSSVCQDEGRIHLVFVLLKREWVIIYHDDRHNLRIRGFSDKEQLQEYLATAYAKEVAIDGIEMVLECGRPRRFQIEVKPRIGF